MASGPLHCDFCKMDAGTDPVLVEACRHIHCRYCKRGMTMKSKIHGSRLTNCYKCLICHRYGKLLNIDSVKNNEQVLPSILNAHHRRYEHEAVLSKQGPDVHDQYSQRYEIRGLKNSKLTCAINAVVQVLAQTPGFFEDVHDYCSKSKQKYLASTLLEVIVDVNGALGQSSTEALQAEVIRRGDDFSFWKQHDCHSFLLCLIEALREDLGKDSMELFTGQIKNRFECAKCMQKECSELQDFTSLCIPVTEKSVDNGIQLLFRKERLADSNMLCRSCSKGQKSGAGKLYIKELLLERAPSIFILQLARFKEVRTSNGLVKLEKLQTLVPYNKKIQLHTGEKSLVTYKLYAIISHLGTIEGGHYVSYVQTLKGQRDLATPTHRDNDTRGHARDRSSTWYHCTDSIVTRVSPDNGYPICSDAYLLFYHKMERSC
ncbi:ubiquitin carboxyl-terminal hydrolase 2-like [Pecten maximus]|uniref:ubiquitin carboxyl-terminal hydrolase 2-like n=1 Tax=Pecten maximus TaxID=6579 RepID=UPI001458E28B|nr:ubiquitin carboxyl-terminal hydrolase 2-like [Pecten maximus]